ncbi:MAG TPA: aldo/keto reductase [Candidatus Binatus sp.]|nr:aldo/keto reductase [Candidatus Binatus sp.]
MKRSRDGSIIGRREFLRAGVLAGVGVSILPLAGAANASLEAAPQVRRYSTLGRTGLKISDISFGGSRLVSGEEDLVRHAFDCGVNYFDSADSYTDGESETVIGNALKGKRDKVYLTSKQMAQADDKRDAMMQTLNGSLRRLQTDHVDVYFNHAVNDPARLKNPEWHEFTAQARKQGKIRFVGMSGHAGNLAECLNYAIDSNQVDVILCAHNFGQDPRFFQRFTRDFDFVARQPELPGIMEKAKQHGVGVVVMKTLMGARLNDMRPYESGGATFSQAAFRWVLSNQNVDALIVTMTSRQMIDEYLGASGARVTAAADLQLLNRYASLNGDSQCRPACNECANACPYGVPIADVMRTRMYARDYRDTRFARTEYSMLSSNAAACLTCDAKPCAGSCPHGIATDVLLAPTHRMLA